MSDQIHKAEVEIAKKVRVRKTTRAFLFSLAGGVLIFFGGISRLLVMLFASSSILPNMIDPAYSIFQQMGMMGGLVAYTIAGVEAISGAFVIFAAAMMYHHHPAKASYWGNWVLVWSFVSLIGSGGLLFGAVLGIIGAAFALLLRPSPPKTYPAFTRV